MSSNRINIAIGLLIIALLISVYFFFIKGPLDELKRFLAEIMNAPAANKKLDMYYENKYKEALNFNKTCDDPDEMYWYVAGLKEHWYFFPSIESFGQVPFKGLSKKVYQVAKAGLLPVHWKIGTEIPPIVKMSTGDLHLS